MKQQLHLTDETLMAYVDGELDPPMTAAVEEAMSRDSLVLRRTAGFLRSRQLARRALLSAPTEVPDALRRLVAEKALAPLPPKAPAARFAPRGLRAALLPLAASVLAIAAGTIGYFLAERRDADLIPRLGGGPVVAALNELPSGSERDLADGRLRAISTVRVGDALCREMRLDRPDARNRLVACRSGAEWTTAFALVEPTDDGYRPAGQSDDLVAQFLDGAGAGAPLFGAEEQRALLAH